MAKPVVLTPIARADLDNVLAYLAENWGVFVLENFLALYEAKIAVIAEWPARYPFINIPKRLRKAVLTRHNIILYREEAEQVTIISIFDTRQDPEKIGLLP